MAQLIESPKLIQAAGNLPKVIEEYFGAVNTEQKDLSIAIMRSPQGWEEPGQTPEFDEYTLLISGQLKIETKTQSYNLTTGQAFSAKAGEWVRYSTPDSNAEYVAICLPAFTPAGVFRDNA